MWLFERVHGTASALSRLFSKFFVCLRLCVCVCDAVKNSIKAQLMCQQQRHKAQQLVLWVSLEMEAIKKEILPTQIGFRNGLPP